MLTFAQQLSFVAGQRQKDETTILAEAVRQGIQSLYRETLIEAYLMGKVSREAFVQEIGLEEVEEIEYQREALNQDILWGTQRG